MAIYYIYILIYNFLLYFLYQLFGINHPNAALDSSFASFSLIPLLLQIIKIFIYF